MIAGSIEGQSRDSGIEKETQVDLTSDGVTMSQDVEEACSGSILFLPERSG